MNPFKGIIKGALLGPLGMAHEMSKDFDEKKPRQRQKNAKKPQQRPVYIVQTQQRQPRQRTTQRRGAGRGWAIFFGLTAMVLAVWLLLEKGIITINI